MERDARAEHVETLRAQAAGTLAALRKTSDLLERLLASDELRPDEIDRARSQSRAALRALRSTNQLLAQAAALTDRSATGGTANGTDRDRTRARMG